MKVVETPLKDVAIFEPQAFADDRGHFYESFNARKFAELAGSSLHFVQDNHSRSKAGVVRGLHYQLKFPQGKLVRVVQGAVFDVAVDLRRSSATFGQWFGTELSAENRRQLWIPPGFGHGFAVISESADFLYKTTDFWHPEDEHCIRYNDETLAIDWHLAHPPVVSQKDLNGTTLLAAEVFD
jgi:dTDP-4-dehydrorhamnose 3,5-epimerase